MRRPAIGIAIVASLLALAPSRAAYASDTTACLDAAERGEQQKKRGQLTGARTELAVCARDVCPAPVRTMCRAYLDEVETAMPTLEVAARDGERRPIAGVRVVIDGVARTPGPDGTYAVDPGARTVRVEHGERSEESLVKVTVGQKRTPVVVVFGARPAEPAPVAPPAARPTSEARPNRLPWILGGAGILALGGATVFGLKWVGDAECRPGCTPAETDRVRTDAVVTDVLAGVGLVSLGIAAVMLLTADAPVRDAGRTAR